jgi:hypothetical protein
MPAAPDRRANRTDLDGEVPHVIPQPPTAKIVVESQLRGAEIYHLH